ncbi:hypothetical protein CR194_15885 [Salipaludibacillus keqinensis]|uniref:Adenosylcobinamide kinase n=1 Tax=Salipaludibacillus keqinensis TaxID=2045207 RepID=A0A323TI46_9BACI|nr:bifunctional adenosylcobinamide kinase/adenosylcobinamide-phosphate guanylyltransferase [Salipaludibacillus keqinensis]PYZ92313.1 hypothetical protein CR194_15885 [Salipaludibacillus keqinensis]
MIMFVSGGARSGKSRFAEDMALTHYHRGRTSKQLIYVATALRTDKEMEDRISTHRVDRSSIWETVEEPFHIVKVCKESGFGDVILVDCLTIWLSNMMYGKLEYSLPQLIEMIDSCILIAEEKRQTLIFVSNDVNEGEIASGGHSAVLDYIYALERIHQHVVTRVDEAVQVIAGIPVYWKGGGS